MSKAQGKFDFSVHHPFNVDGYVILHMHLLTNDIVCFFFACVLIGRFSTLSKDNTPPHPHITVKIWKEWKFPMVGKHFLKDFLQYGWKKS